jgi:hypothetical protein
VGSRLVEGPTNDPVHVGQRNSERGVVGKVNRRHNFFAAATRNLSYLDAVGLQASAVPAITRVRRR